MNERERQMVKVLRELVADEDFCLELLDALDPRTLRGIEDLVDLRAELRPEMRTS